MSIPAAEPVVPPVRRAVTVRSDREHVFDVFVRELGSWWPIDPLCQGDPAEVETVRVEPQLGGRVYEVWRDGTEIEWGEILAWDPPMRLVMTWTSTGVATEVELRFIELAPTLTRVELEHRGWERLPADLARTRPDDYAKGWGMVLERFAAACS